MFIVTIPRPPASTESSSTEASHVQMTRVLRKHPPQSHAWTILIPPILLFLPESSIEGTSEPRRRRYVSAQRSALTLCTRLFKRDSLSFEGFTPPIDGSHLFVHAPGVATSIISHLVQGRYKYLADIPQSLAPGPY